jgi:hypothetical protein
MSRHRQVHRSRPRWPRRRLPAHSTRRRVRGRVRPNRLMSRQPLGPWPGKTSAGSDPSSWNRTHRRLIGSSNRSRPRPGLVLFRPGLSLRPDRPGRWLLRPGCRLNRLTRHRHRIRQWRPRTQRLSRTHRRSQRRSPPLPVQDRSRRSPGPRWCRSHRGPDRFLWRHPVPVRDHWHRRWHRRPNPRGRRRNCRLHPGLRRSTLSRPPAHLDRRERRLLHLVPLVQQVPLPRLRAHRDPTVPRPHLRAPRLARSARRRWRPPARRHRLVRHRRARSVPPAPQTFR